jgi:hypothetical protein
VKDIFQRTGQSHVPVPLFRTPPQPPPRWSKPPTPVSPTFNEANPQQKNNFTVTTTVTFSVDGQQSPQIVEVSSPTDNQVVRKSSRVFPERSEHVNGNNKFSLFSFFVSRSRRITVSNHIEAFVAGGGMPCGAQRNVVVARFKEMAATATTDQQRQNAVANIGRNANRSNEEEPPKGIETLSGALLFWLSEVNSVLYN